MAHILQDIKTLFSAAFQAAFGPEYAETDPVLRFSSEPKFGDLQANFAMQLAKSMGKPPRALAEAVVKALPANSSIASCEVAGPGFINIKLADSYVGAREIGRASCRERM